MEKLEKAEQLFHSELSVINIGTRALGESLEHQGIKVTYVDWKPSAGGDKHMQDLLSKLGGF